jgi:hypothetical protein
MIGVEVMAKGIVIHGVEVTKLSINTAGYFNLEIHNKLHNLKLVKPVGGFICGTWYGGRGD